MSEALGNKDMLIAALMDWWAENTPNDPADARLMQAIWRYEGDHTKPCDGCDGDCGEACAPCTAADAIAGLDNFIADYNKQRGIVVVAA